MRQASARRSSRITAPLSCLAAAAGTLLAMTPAAQAATPTDWHSYVQAPKSSDARAVRASVLAGNVHDPSGLVTRSAGSTTLRVAPQGGPATVLLDYGKEVVGTPYVTVASYSNAGSTPALHLTFSETRKYLFSPGASTLAVAARAGATTVTVSAASTFAVGDTVRIGSQTDRLVAVADATLTLARPLRSDASTGTPVTSTPGALSGDGVGVAGYSRPQSIALTSRSQFSGSFEGGFRFETITLTTPGTVVLRAAGLHFQAYRATPAQYQGHFLSSSNALNRMWFDGAYTEQTDMAPAGGQGAGQASVLDGAKRDRKIWSGDIATEGQGILDSLGSNGAGYVKQSLRALLTLSTPGSGLAGYANPAGGSDGHDPAYSNTYSSWTVDDIAAYFRATDDTAFARHALPYVEGQLSYDATLTNDAGLLVTANVFGGANSGLDWDIYDGPKAGVVASANMMYYRALVDVAYVESQLGDSAKAAAYLATAARLKHAINADLFNPSLGAYDFSETSRGVIAQDANSFAILYGIAPQNTIPGIIAALKSLWGAHGSAPFSANANNASAISPFVTGFEVEALYSAGDATDAGRLLKLTWNQMINPTGSQYTGTFWENYLADGTLQDGSISASHGWSSGPTPALTSYVLGVQARDAGYKTFTVTPHFGGVSWVKGAVPTPYGQIRVAWSRRGSAYDLTVRAPAGTAATIVVPGGTVVTIHGGAHGTARTVMITA